MKTLLSSKFGGRLTLGEVERIAPSAIWRLGVSSDTTRSAFSHNLGQQLSFAKGGYWAACVRALDLQASGHMT